MTKKTFLSSSTLKIIAMICMLIDHVAAGLLVFKFQDNQIMGMQPYYLYNIMRNIGRIAFPIFLFLLIEGFYKTKNFKKYLLRLILFAFISEVPFDLALKSGYFDMSGQNVYFELALIMIMLYFLDVIDKKMSNIKSVVLKVSVVLILCVIAEIINADYGLYGIVAAFIMYTFNWSREAKALGIVPAFAFEINMPTVFLACPIVYFYNGKRGLNLKYIFYIFYPLHLLMIGLIKIYIVNV